MELWILALWILTIVGTEVSSYECRNGWLNYEDSCYLFVTNETENWIQAMTYCSVFRGYLLDILDEHENTFVKSELTHMHAPGCYYMSATDVEVEGQWRWTTTDSLVEYTDWASGEPQNAGAGENFVCLRTSTHYHWIDVPCHSERHFICKMRLDAGIENNIIG